MAAYKPWRDKSYLYNTYVTKRMTLAQIVEDCKKMGYSVTEMTIYNNLISNSIPIRGGNRKLGSRSVGGSGKGFYG
jgi:hypothetical protein